MISFLEGTIEHLGDNYVILSTGGIGYRVHITPKYRTILSKARGKSNPVVNFPAGSLGGKAATGKSTTGQASSGTETQAKIRMFVHSQLNMREGTFDLYGFPKKEDLDLFGLLISVSGIGPKNAMGILTAIDPAHLKAAVVNEDAVFLQKVSGIGPKTAKRLVLELKNKVDYLDLGDMKGIDLGQEGQAIEALLALGYTQSQSLEALKTVSVKTDSLQERVREALKMLGRK